MSYKKCRRFLLAATFSAFTSFISVGAFADLDPLQANGLGDWLGVMNTPSGDLRLWLSIERDKQGELQGALESVDQAPGKKMALKNINLEQNVLRFDIPRIAAKYVGHWNTKTKQWMGEFNQGPSFDLTFSRGKPKASPFYDEFDGEWLGEIMGHPLIIRILSGEMGTIAMLDSPDEGVRGLPISALAINDQTVSFEVPLAAVKFK